MATLDNPGLRSLRSSLARRRDETLRDIVFCIRSEYGNFSDAVRSLDSLEPLIENTNRPLQDLLRTAEATKLVSEQRKAEYDSGYNALVKARNQRKNLESCADADVKLSFLESRLGMLKTPDVNAESFKTTLGSSKKTTNLAAPQLEYYCMLLAVLEFALAELPDQTCQFVVMLTERASIVRRSLERLCAASLDELLLTSPDFSSARELTPSIVSACRYLRNWPVVVATFLAVLVDPILRTIPENISFVDHLDVLREALGAAPLAVFRSFCMAAGPDDCRTLLDPLLRRLAGHVASTAASTTTVAPSATTIAAVTGSSQSGASDSRSNRGSIPTSPLTSVSSTSCFTGVPSSAMAAAAATVANSPAVPEYFRLNYLAFVDFLRWLCEAFALPTGAVETPRVLCAALERWPVGIYFQIITHQLALDFDADPSLAAYASVLSKLSFYTVPGIEHRSFKFACQLGTRLRQELEANEPPASLAAALEYLEKLLAVRRGPPKAPTGSLPDLNQEYSKCIKVLANEASKASLQVLSLTRSIVSQFRSTPRAAPVKASTFIPMVFQTLRGFMTAGFGLDKKSAPLSPDYESNDSDAKKQTESPNTLAYTPLKHESPLQGDYDNKVSEVCVENLLLTQLADMCVAQVSKGYYEIVEELLTTLQKTEVSMRRLRLSKGKQIRSQKKLDGMSDTTSSSSLFETDKVADEITDEGKIRLQISLDVEAYHEEIKKIDSVSLETIKQNTIPLYNLLTRFKYENNGEKGSTSAS